MTGVPAPEARALHVLSVVSRSGRAAAEIARIDLDDGNGDLSQVADEAAHTVYSRSGDGERHAALMQAILEALEKVETIPGQPVSAEAALPDGRRARAERIIDW